MSEVWKERKADASTTLWNILLDERVWIAFFDFLVVLIVECLGVDVPPQLFVTLQALVIAIIAALTASDVATRLGS